MAGNNSRFEKKRLLKMHYKEEAEDVQRISQNFANAGFDIKSFNSTSKNNEHDRFIEVKGSVNDDFDIHWSYNEIKTAIELRENYWLYFVPEVNIQTRKTSKELQMIRNPYENILKNSEYKTKIEGYHITRNSDSKE